jgi:hypothetical protein
VHGDPDILGGTPVFRGTEFLDAFPSVKREQLISSLKAAHEALTGHARPARRAHPRQLANQIDQPVMMLLFRQRNQSDILNLSAQKAAAERPELLDRIGGEEPKLRRALRHLTTHIECGGYVGCRRFGSG